MTTSSKVWTEVDTSEVPWQVIRIFRSERAAITSGVLAIYLMDKREAVGSVRKQVFDRQKGHCLDCDEIITSQSMHLHEKIFRGKGGEISLDNSMGLCYSCHEGPSGAHGNRRPQFTRRTR